MNNNYSDLSLIVGLDSALAVKRGFREIAKTSCVEPAFDTASGLEGLI